MSSIGKNDKRSATQGMNIISNILRGIIMLIICLYFFVSVIFIHKASANEASLNELFPIDNNKRIITSWFIGRLVSELVYKTLDANNRNVHSFLGSMRNISRGTGYIILVFILFGLFGAMSVLWLVYGVIITFGQAFIFNMTLPIGWIRSLIILWSVGVASLISGAVMVVYNLIMILYIPFYFSGNLAECPNLTIWSVGWNYIETLSYLSLMFVCFILSTIKLSSRIKSTDNNLIQSIARFAMILFTVLFVWYDIEFGGKTKKLKCSENTEVKDVSDQQVAMFNAILSGNGNVIPKDQMSELSDDFTRFLYKRLLEEKIYTTTGETPDKYEDKRKAYMATKVAHTEQLSKLEKEINQIEATLAGKQMQLADADNGPGSDELEEAVTKLTADLEDKKKRKEDIDKSIEGLGQTFGVMDKPVGEVPIKRPESSAGASEESSVGASEESSVGVESAGAAAATVGGATVVPSEQASEESSAADPQQNRPAGVESAGAAAATVGGATVVPSEQASEESSAADPQQNRPAGVESAGAAAATVGGGGQPPAEEAVAAAATAGGIEPSKILDLGPHLGTPI